MHDNDDSINKGDSELSVSLLNNKEVKRLSTPFNLLVLFLYNFFTTASYTAFTAVGLVNYIPWGMTLVDYVNGALIFLTIQIFTQSIVGIYGDKIVTKYGRRKPYVVAGVLLRFVANVMLSIPPVKHTNLIFAWYAVFGSLFIIGYGLHTNPFNSWMIESTADEADFVKIGTTAAPIGGVLGGISMIFIASMSPILAGLVVLIGGSCAIFATAYFLPSTIYRQAPSVPKPIPSLRICIQSQEFKTILCVGILVGAATSTYATLALFVLSINFDIHRETTVINLTIYAVVIAAVAGLILVIACNWVLQRVDKLRIIVLIMFIVIVCAIGTFFVSLSPSTLYFYVGFQTIIATLGMPVSLIASLLTRDLVLFDTFVTRYNRENMYLTAIGIPSSIIANFLGAIPVVILTLSGFKSKSADDDNLSNMYEYDSTSLWILRISTSFFIAILVFIAYLLVRNYPLTQKICDEINKVVKRRENERETGDLQLRNDETHHETPSQSVSGSLHNSSIITSDLEDEAILTTDEREDLLHLSVAELYRVYSAIDSTVYRPEQGVLLIKTFLKYGFSYACITLVIMLTALVFNTIYLNGLFSTLIIYFILLVAFYAFYEFFRYTTVRQLLHWDPKELKKKARMVFEEFTKKGDNLTTMLAREGIIYDSISQEDEILGVSPKPLTSDNMNEEDVAEEAFVGLSGYKRIFFTLTTLSALSIVVIVVAIMN